MTSLASLPDKVLTGGWNVLQRRLNRSDIQAYCLMILAVYAVLLSISFATQVTGRTIFGPQLGADFGAFYIAGRIYHTVGPARIYDRALHHQVYRELFPAAPADEELPYLNAPFFIAPFPLLARLPYAWAYLCWFLFSLGLYVAGFSLLWRSLQGWPVNGFPVALLLALSFMPFLVECLAGGQTSAIGFFSLALALSCEQQGSPRAKLLGGLALALCWYKPTLFVLLLPMLVLTRRWAMFGGWLLGTLALALLSWLLVGTQGCQNYLRILFLFADASANSATFFKSWKYVDLNSFARALFGAQSALRWMSVVLVVTLALPWFALVWWRTAHARAEYQPLVWAGTISATLVFNIYLGIYDVTLVVLSVMLTASVLYRWANRRSFTFPTAYKLILVALYLVPWVTQPIARMIGVQLLTLVLLWLTIYQFNLLGEAAPRTRSI